MPQASPQPHLELEQIQRLCEQFLAEEGYYRSVVDYPVEEIIAAMSRKVWNFVWNWFPLFTLFRLCQKMKMSSMRIIWITTLARRRAILSPSHAKVLPTTSSNDPNRLHKMKRWQRTKIWKKELANLIFQDSDEEMQVRPITPPVRKPSKKMAITTTSAPKLVSKVMVWQIQ